MGDQRVGREGGGTGPPQVFSSDNDVLPEQGDRLRPLKVGCLAWLTYKIGCLLIMLAMILFVGLIAKFYGPPPRGPNEQGHESGRVGPFTEK